MIDQAKRICWLILRIAFCLAVLIMLCCLARQAWPIAMDSIGELFMYP